MWPRKRKIIMRGRDYFYLPTDWWAGIAQSICNGIRAGWPRLDSRQGQEGFLYSIASRPDLRPTQPPIKWVPVALSSGTKRPGREADPSLLSNAGVKNGGAIFPLPHVYMAWWLIN
jgi:hypothetical protein